MKDKPLYRVLSSIFIVCIALLMASMPLMQTLAQGGNQGIKKSAPVRTLPAEAADLAVDTIEAQTGPVRVFLQLTTPSVTEAIAKSGKGIAGAQAINVENDQKTIEAAFAKAGLNVQITDRLKVSINGFIAVVDAKQIRQIAAVSGVKRVFAAETIYPDLGTSIPKVGVPPVWAGGFRGEGTRIAIIDSGLDYKHPNFGGNAGTTWATRPAKVVGGYDFVGDLYGTLSTTPAPDPDPYTCDPANVALNPNHHGTHVAGIAAGYGVTAAMSTFAGPYDATVPFGSLYIAPGVAPLASLLIYRVFGCSGSTDTLNVVAAIERSMDPDQNGDPSDRADVINMSLGSNYGDGFGPEGVAIENASLVGTVVVAASGNASDSFYITSNPAAADAAISVAGTSAYVPSVTYNSVTYYGSGAAFGPRYGTPVISGTIQRANPANGCTAGSFPAFVAGRIAMVDRGTCEFDNKVYYAQLAGASAVIICNNSAAAPIPMGSGTDGIPASPALITIPSTMLLQANCNTMKTGSVAGGALVNSGSIGVDANANGIYSSTSRGARRSSTSSRIVLKPDVAAPGENVMSSIGYSSRDSYSGTSMATPHIAGLAALLRQQNPTWTPAEIKALIMDTSNVDIPVTVGTASPIYGPGRMGTGRMDAGNAFNLAGGGPKVIAYDQAAPELVSVSFGLIEAVGAYTATRTIELKNKSGVAVTYNVSLQNVVTEAGSSASLSASSVTVPANGTATVNVTVSGNPYVAGSFNRDVSTVTTQLGVLREWLAEVAGYVTFTATNQPSLRVAYHAVVRPASNMTAQDVLNLTGTSGNTSITLSGTGFLTSALGIASNSPSDVTSIVSPFNLAYTSPNEPDAFDLRENNADIQYVGVTSDRRAHAGIAGTQIFFAIATQFDWATLKEIQPYIIIDRDQNGSDDFCLTAPRITDTSPTPIQQDLFISVLRNGTCTTSLGFEDEINPAYVSVDPLRTYRFNSNVMVLAVSASGSAPFGGGSLGLVANQTFNYRVEFDSVEFGQVDVTPTLSYNVDADPLSFVDVAGALGGPYTGLPWYDDRPALGGIPVDFNTVGYAGGPLRALLIHYQNAQTFTRPELVCINGTGLPVAAGCANATGPTVPGNGTAPGGVFPVATNVPGSGSGLTEIGGNPSSLPSTGYSPAVADNTVSAAAGILMLAGLLMLGISVISLRRRRK